MSLSDKDNFENTWYEKLSRREVRSLIFHLLYAMETLDYDSSLESVVDNYNKAYPDDTRISDCIETTKRYLEGNCTLQVLEAAARSAARSATESTTWSAARSAAESTESAAWSARSAARSAAESAAWSTESAMSAAESAAESAESAA